MPVPNVATSEAPIAQYGRNLVISIIATPNRSPANSYTRLSYLFIVSPSRIVCSVCADIT